MSKAVDEDSERLARWKSRWDENKIGWHEESPHEALVKYGESHLFPTAASCPASSRVFVPLCGKSVDMAYLAQQDFVAELVGVDGIQKALDTFAQEHGEFEIQPAGKIGDYDRLTGQKITLLKGDYFNLDDSATNGRFGAVFDRASMVAIQPSLRVDYVQTMSKLLAPGGRILLAVIERNSGTEDDKKGPPFSVPEAEVRRLYEGQEWVESVVLLEQGGEKERNEGTSWLS